MEKYTKAQMEVIEFEAEDVITTSSASNSMEMVGFGANDDASEEGRSFRRSAFS